MEWHRQQHLLVIRGKEGQTCRENGYGRHRHSKRNEYAVLAGFSIVSHQESFFLIVFLVLTLFFYHICLFCLDYDGSYKVDFKKKPADFRNRSKMRE